VVDAATERKLTDALESQGYGVAPVIHREPLSRQSNSIVMGLGPEGEKLADALRGSLRGLLQSPGGPEERYVLPETSFPDADVLIWLGELDVTPPEVVDVVDESGGRGRNVREFLEGSGISVRRVEGGHGRVSARTTILWPPGRERFARYVAEALAVDAKLYPTTGLRTIVHLGKDIRF
jgi:hypothetical protein